MHSTEFSVGFFGKLPQLGDFVERRVHPGFRKAWDDWLQDSLSDSHEKLGDRWLDAYLVSPIWRFVLTPAVAGEAAHAGVMVPSVDRVGRYFPLTVVAALPAETACLSLLAYGHRWFEAVTVVLEDILAGKTGDIDTIDAGIGALQDRLAATVAGLRERPPKPDDLAALLIELASAETVPQGILGLSEPLLLERLNPAAFWLTDGSANITPRLLITRGLPAPAVYASMLDGSSTVAQLEYWSLDSSVEELTRPTPQVASAAHTDRGHVRDQNEDSFVSRQDLGLWAVADGMGGYEDGAKASAAVCDRLEAGLSEGDLDQRVASCIDSLQTLNAELRQAGKARERTILSASTVVVLLMSFDRWACLWSGDSRLYRLRANQLEQLSRDHSTGKRGSTSAEEGEYFVTAGVGTADELKVDVLYGDLASGDRFLLCSDGLYEGCDEATLSRALSVDAPRACVRELIVHTLAGAANDNATAVTIFT